LKLITKLGGVESFTKRCAVITRVYPLYSPVLSTVLTWAQYNHTRTGDLWELAWKSTWSTKPSFQRFVQRITGYLSENVAPI